MAIGNKNNKTHTIGFRMVRYLFWMQKKWLKIWKPVFLIKFCLSRKTALVLQPRQPMWEGVPKLNPPPFFGREWADIHNRRNPGQKNGVVVFPTLSPGPHKRQKLRPQEIKRVLFFPPQYYVVIKLLTSIWKWDRWSLPATSSLCFPTKMGSHYGFLRMRTNWCSHIAERP